jgi:aminopeptidase-like protein
MESLKKEPVLEKPSIKDEMESYFDRLWPVCRSITGEGLRESFRILQEIIPLNLHEVKTGTPVFDWTVPDEWNIRDAFIITPEGKKIADFKVNNLHVVNYSEPVEAEMSFDELNQNLHYKKELPDAVPYITTYYRRRWGFCISYNQWKELPRDGTYKVLIDSKLEPGSLTYGDIVLPGETDSEILFSSYLCHPSMANNELSGPLALVFLYRELEKLENRRYTCRFVIAPETIGAICNLHENGLHLRQKVIAGYVFTCCGDCGKMTFKQTREPGSLTNRITAHVLDTEAGEYRTLPFDPIGSDERQYASPGFNLPVGVLMRTPFSEYPEYHTSLDNKELMDFEKMEELVKTCVKLVKAYNLNGVYENEIRYGEPFLGKRDLFEDLSSKRSHSDTIKMRLRLLNYLDGTRDLLEVCERYGYNLLDLEGEIKQLLEHGLLSRVWP